MSSSPCSFSWPPSTSLSCPSSSCWFHLNFFISYHSKGSLSQQPWPSLVSCLVGDRSCEKRDQEWDQESRLRLRWRIRGDSRGESSCCSTGKTRTPSTFLLPLISFVFLHNKMIEEVTVNTVYLTSDPLFLWRPCSPFLLMSLHAFLDFGLLLLRVSWRWFCKTGQMSNPTNSHYKSSYTDSSGSQAHSCTSVSGYFCTRW